MVEIESLFVITSVTFQILGVVIYVLEIRLTLAQQANAAIVYPVCTCGCPAPQRNLESHIKTTVY